MSEKKNIAFIINPISGVGKKNTIPPLIEKHLDKSRFKAEIIYTKYRGHGIELASDLKKRCDAVVAVGGDGSVNEIGSALVFSDCALGIIPCGSGNGLARHAGVPLNFANAIKRINLFEVKKTDAGEVNGKLFLGTCGFGFDAHIAKKFDEYHTRGFMSYIKLVAREYKTFQPKKVIIDIDGTKNERDVFMCSVANSSQFGNGFTISPLSDLADGIFELVILKQFSKRHLPGLARRFFSKSIHRSALFESFEFRNELILTTADGSNTWLHIDGDPAGEAPAYQIKLHRLALNMI